jgi:hypothetical protein
LRSSSITETLQARANRQLPNKDEVRRGHIAPFVNHRVPDSVSTRSTFVSKDRQSVVLHSDAVEPSLHPDQYTEFLEQVEERQENLRDAREELIGSRFRLQVQRKELLNTREQAASQAGAAFDRIVQYLLKTGVDLPDEIKSAFTQAETLRNNLGVKEVEYDEAERAYNLEEWRYTKKEAQFIDDLPRNAPVSSLNNNRSASPLGDTEAFARISYAPQDIADLVAESEGELLPTTYIADVPLYDDRTDLSVDQGNIWHDVYKDVSTPGAYDSFSTQGEQAGPVRLLSLDDLDKGNVRSSRAGTQAWVNRWLMNALHSSRLEKRRLRCSLRKVVQDDSAWWRLVTLYWFQDGEEAGQNHTGDTTVSDEAPSEPVSSNAMRQLFDTSDTTGSAKQQFSSTPLVARDEIIDDPELLSFPTVIEPHDLVDSPKHVKNFVASYTADSRSTRSERSRVSSPPAFYPSISTIEETPSCVSSVHNDVPGIDKEASVSGPRGSKSRNVASQTDPQAGGGIFAVYLWDDGTLKVPEFSQEHKLVSLSSSKAEPPRSNDTSILIKGKELKHDTKQADSDNQASVPAHASDENLSASAKQVEAQASIPEPYIRIKSQKGWSLPLLRLTASSTSQYVQPTDLSRIHRLESLPFVSMPDAPFRLPGPSLFVSF